MEANPGAPPPCSARGLVRAIDKLSSRGHTVFCAMPEYFYNGGRNGTQFAHEHTLLRPYLEDGRLVLLPGVLYDDEGIINLAIEKDAVVLTNDGFNDHVRKGVCSREWCSNRLCPYYWLNGDELMPGKPML